MIEVLFGLLFVLGLITVIGHAIWVLLAMFFRAISGESKSPPATSGRCVECGASMRLGDDFCSACGRWQIARSSPGPIPELSMAARQLDRLLNQGKLDVATHRRVMQVIEEERVRLTDTPRWDAVTTPREVEPGLATVEEIQSLEQPVATQTTPAIVEQTVFANREEVESAGIQSEPAYPVDSAPAVPAEDRSQPEPRRSFTEMLETFMEESSIRWAELIGGLLIIGGSIALVISLWSEIAAKPFLRFSVFIGMTAALFGLGFYSAHRWKLPTTSRGVLIISTLLVPLNFLAMTAFSSEAVPASFLIVSGELLSLALFLFLVYQAARVIAPESAWMMVLAVLGPSFAMLMARHSGDAQTGWFILLGIAPLLCYWISCGAMLRNLVNRDDVEERETDQVFTELGIASFATLLPLGLLFVKPHTHTLRQYAPLVSLFGVPAIATGIAMLQGAGERQSGKTQTAATSIAIVGSLISLAALLFAWPNPVAVTVTALVNCVVCAAVAVGSSRQVWRYDLKLAHAGAIAHLTLAFLVVANLFNHNVVSWVEDGPRLANSFISKTSGVSLLLLFVLLAVVSESCSRFGRRVEARIHAIGSLAIGAFSILLVTAHSFGLAGDPHHAWLIYAFYSMAAFVIAWRRQRAAFSWIGNALMLLGIVQLLAFRLSGTFPQPVRLSFQIFASVATLCAIAASVKSEQLRRLFGQTFTSSALISSLAVAPFVLFGGWITNAQISTRMLWLAAIWLVIACLKSWPLLFAAFQLALGLCVAFAVAALFGHQWPHSIWPDVLAMQSQAIALALLSLAWIALRLIYNPVVAAKLLYPAWPGIDRIFTLLLLGCLVVFSVYGAHTGMVEELFPGQALSDAGRAMASTALGAGSWYLLLALSLVFIVGLWERFEKRGVLALQILLVSACLLIAGRWQAEGTTATIYRWIAAFSFAFVSVLIVFRDRVAQLCGQFAWPQMEVRSSDLARLLRLLSLALFVAPVLVITLITFFNATSAPITIDSLSERGGVVARLIGPVLLIGLSFIALALRERFAAYACAAGLMLNLTVTLGYLLAKVISGAPLETAGVFTLAQLNIIATSVFSLVWIAAHRQRPWPRSEGFLKTQINVALISALLLLALADACLFLAPLSSNTLANSFGGVLGWLAVLLPMLAFAQFYRLKPDRLRVEQFGIGLLAIGSLVVCALSRLDDGWIAYRALMLTVNAAAWLMLAMRWFAINAAQNRTNESLVESGDLSTRLKAAFVQIGNQRPIEVWIAALACAIFPMILRGVSSPGEPWWTLSFSISVCLLFAGLSVVSGQRGYIYLANAALNIAATRFYFWAIPKIGLFSEGRPSDKLIGFLTVNAIALALPAIAWLALDLKVLRRRGQVKAESWIIQFHRTAALISLVLSSFILFCQWIIKFDSGVQPIGYVVLIWLALVSAILLLIACLWDEGSGYALRGLYGIGLIAVGMGFAMSDLGNDDLLVGAVIALSLYALATGSLWRKRELLSKWTGELHIQSDGTQSSPILSWLIAANLSVGVAGFALALATVFNVESLAQRLIATTAAFAIPISLALFAEDGRNQRLITVCLRLSLLNVVLWGWAWLSPVGGGQSVDRLVDRLVILMVVAEVFVIGYRLAVSRGLSKDDAWWHGLRRDLLWIAGAGLASLAVVLGVEASNYLSHGSVLVSWPVVITVLATLIALSSTSIAFALLPGKDPFNLDERGRMNYVYVAEVLLVLTLLHLRLTMPWLFSGFFQTYWPLIVMLVAFTGVGLGELFRRWGKPTLAEPLERTGILLPLLPVIGFWVVRPEISYSGLLFLVGLFYGVLSVTQRSFRFGVLAALAGNGGWWHFLSGEEGYRLYEHPQLWLIPISLSVLVAARINRDRLTPDQTTVIRYSSLMMIYISSTADIFINGVRESPWLTMVLAVLSVAGVIAGLMLRVRAFLFLGTAFLLLSVLTMIWTASVNLGWEWLWYLAVIAFGVLILFTFALFERKRNEMLGLVERLKQWQA